MNRDPEITLAFLQALMPRGSDVTIEFRVFRAMFHKGLIAPAQFNRTLAGWYDDLHSLLVDAERLRGVSGYVTFNPCNPALLARSYNKLEKATHATKDEDIVSLRWLYVDIDPVRPADISSTDDELAAALARRDTILADHPGLAASSLWGCSGNGGFILTRLDDLPNEVDGRQTVASALATLANRYSDAAVKVDVSTKNPARVMCLPGSIKCKGSSIPGRPWRLVTLDSPRGRQPEPFALAAWVAEHGAPEGPPSVPAVCGSVPWTPDRSTRPNGPSGGGLAVASDVDRIRRAALYLDRMAPAVSGQNGHGQTFDAACALVKGFDLDLSTARPILAIWNQRCQPPWTAAELDHKLTDADERPDDKPRGYLYETPRHDAPARMAPPFGSDTPALPPDRPGGPGRPDEDEGPCPIGHEDNPHRLARAFIRQKHNHAEGITLRFWNDEFHAWKSGAYHHVSKSEVKAQVADFTADEFERIYHLQIMMTAMSEDKTKAPRPLPVTTNIVSHIYQALSGEALLEASKHPAQPCWLEGENSWPVSEVLPMRNALVHLPSFLEGLPCTRKPTPRLFCPYALGYDWNPQAPTPEKWLEFLGQLWPNDPESIQTLQEWMGLQLVPDTSYQKIMAFIGPPRSGKGTIGRILQAMVGPENVAGPTLSSLGLDFGLQSLIGKLSAIIDDARLSGKSDQAVIAERLLSISGEGRLTVGRKYRSDWIGTLPCRITLISNELPRLTDSSGALPKRFVVLRFTRSFLGQEDTNLAASLLAELPGILLWAIEGWRRLKARGFLQQPESGDEIALEMEELSSPIGAFVSECCNVGPDESVVVPVLYERWRTWCQDNGRREPGIQSIFGRDLRTVVPELHTDRKQDGGSRVRVFHGVGLKPPASLTDSDTEESQTGFTDASGVPF